MQTYTHFVMTAVFNRRNRDGELAEDGGSLPPLRTRASLIGSFMPDFPLTLLTIIFIVIDRVQGNQMSFDNETFSWVGYLFEDLFFNNAWVKLLHNLFHAPLLTLLYTFIGYRAWKSGRTWGPSLFWFGVACSVHTLIDIPIHYDDGPLLLFPFNWNLRFHSPVSYWDPARFGTQFTIFEHSLFIIMVIWLATKWLSGRRAAREKI